MLETVVYLIRHGEIANPENVYYGRTIPVQLTKKGKEDIRLIGEQIKAKEVEKIEKIYASPLERTAMSARILSSVFNNAQVVLDDNLLEVDIPALVGHSMNEKEAILKRGIDEYNEEFVAIGNESKRHVATRMLKVFNKVGRENRGKAIVLVSHGDPLCILYFCLTHPKETMPLMQEMNKIYYPLRGEGYKVTLDSEENCIDFQFISKTVV